MSIEEGLINSLATVIVLYHDTHVRVPCVKAGTIPREHAINILKTKDYAVQLETLNYACTKAIRNDGRYEFFKFIINEIVALKNLVDNKTILSTEKLRELEGKIALLLTELQKLLVTDSTKTTQVHANRPDYSDVASIPLKGMLEIGNFSESLCRTGNFIKDEVLAPLGLNAKCSAKKITAAAKLLCHDIRDASAKAAELAARVTKVVLEKRTEELAAVQKSEAQLKAELEKTKAALAEAQAKLTKEKPEGVSAASAAPPAAATPATPATHPQSAMIGGASVQAEGFNCKVPRALLSPLLQFALLSATKTQAQAQATSSQGSTSSPGLGKS